MNEEDNFKFLDELRGLRDSWQPIATAPKDGRYILVAFKNSNHVDFYCWNNTRKAWQQGVCFTEAELSHWMPAPQHPNNK